MTTGLYLGRERDVAGGRKGEPLRLDPADLLTHGLIVGMTGSGKTGLAVVMIEEALRQGVPVLAIDPKGDLGNLLLLFERYEAAAFAPWVDPEAARRAGKDVATFAAETAAAWSKGVGEWGLSEQDAAALLRSREAVVYTPGSRAGVPLAVLQSLQAPAVLQSLSAPAVPFEAMEEDLRDEIATIVSGLLGLLRVEADPLRSREHILLSKVVENAWREGWGLTLEDLIAAVAEPPFEKLGALPVEAVYPRKDRQELLMGLNGLLASPSFEVWREGEPLDAERLLRSRDGRPRLSVVSTAHLSDEERLFVTALLLEEVKGWMRRQPGTQALRALVYMDEIFGYFPPHPANPPTKKPLLTLLKQARAQGVGVVLATQNPVDLDYKGLANIGTWLVGKLQTAQDRERLREGLTGVGLDAAEVDRLLDATAKRVFLLHDVHRPGPTLVETRWALSYLRGPLTRDEIARLTKSRSPAEVASAGPAAPAPPRAADEGSRAPVLPPPLTHHHWNRFGGSLAEPHLFAKYVVRTKDQGETVGVKAWALAGTTLPEALQGEALDLEEADLQAEVPPGVRHGELPAYLATTGAREIERAVKERLPGLLAFRQFVDPVTRQASNPGETEEAFVARLSAAGGGPAVARLREKLERKRHDLATCERDVSGRKQEKWLAVGSAILSNIGLLTGRKRTISGASTVLSKNRMEDNAEARLAALRAEVARLEEEVSTLVTVDPARFETKEVVPPRTAVKLLRYDLVWVR